MKVTFTDMIIDTDLDVLERLYTASFPPQERRMWCEIMMPASTEGPFLRGVECDGRLAGLVTLWYFADMTYIEHFAVDPAFRGSGIGAEVVRQLIAESRVPVVLEVERPEAGEMARRRIAFYERCGMRIIKGDYVQPPYYPGLPEVPMYLMSSGEIGGDEAAEVLHSRVYGR